MLLLGKINETVKNIQEVYLKDPRVLYVAYSGGKDSTTTLALVIRAIMELPKEKRTKKIYAIMSDTGFEFPPVMAQVFLQIERLKKFIKKHDLPLEFEVVTPEVKDSFNGMFIGAGQPLPRRDNRACSVRMKVIPQEKAIARLLDAEGSFVAVTGTRAEEGSDRRKRMESKTVKGSYVKKHDIKDCGLMCPIEFWNIDDVWGYIQYDDMINEWIDTDGLSLIYSEASGDGDECTTVLHGKEKGGNPGCGKSSRFGCPTCTLHLGDDKALTNLTKGHEYLKYMVEYRDWLITYRDGHWDTVRDVYNHRAFKKTVYNRENIRMGTVMPGGSNLEFRREMLRRFMGAEAKIREHSPHLDITLVSDAELEYIQQRWLKEGDFGLLCVAIAKSFGRDVHINDEYKKKLSLAKRVYALQDFYSLKLKVNFGIYPNERFASQFVEVFAKKETLSKVEYRVSELEKHYKEEVSGIQHWFVSGQPMEQVIMGTALAEQLYPSAMTEEFIRKEWKNDKVWYFSAIQLEEAGGLNLEIEENLAHKEKMDRDKVKDEYDFTEDVELSLDEKMAMMEGMIEENRSELRGAKDNDIALMVKSNQKKEESKKKKEMKEKKKSQLSLFELEEVT